jgi:hypothetical protein
MNDPWFIGIATGIIAGLVVAIIIALFKKSRSWTIIGIIALIIAVIFLFSNKTTPSDNSSPTSPITTQTPALSTVPTTQPTSTITIVSGENVSVEMQPSSNVLTFSKFDKDEGLYWTTTYTLTGYVTAVIKNPTPNDVTIFVIIDFQLPGIPSVSSSTVRLINEKVSWTLITANTNELKFQTSGWGLTLSAGQKLTLPLTLTLSVTQRSAITSNPWQQSYPFTVTASVN